MASDQSQSRLSVRPSPADNRVQFHTIKNSFDLAIRFHPHQSVCMFWALFSQTFWEGGRMENNIPDSTRLGYVQLIVRDLARMLDFYCQVLGFEKADEDADGVALKPRQGEVLIKLIHDPQALPAESQTSGLYHFALLLPQRLDLARVLQHLLTSKVQLQGAADHLVSEALYLPDPEGNGIELYADRPRAQWPQMDGRLMMATDPLDFDSLLAELDRAPGSWEGIAAGTRLGHIHLHVGDLDIARYFYEQLLGFDMMAMYGLSAAFLAAGGYHHHIGINTWAGQGAPPPAPGSAGLDHFSIELPELEALHSIQERLDKAGAPLESLDGGLMTRDPFGAGVFLRSVAEFQA